MKVRKTLLAALATAFLVFAACNSPSSPSGTGPCGEDVMARFLQSKQAEWSSRLTSESSISIYGSSSVDNLTWDIDERGETGCVVTLSADVNGKSTDAFVWYIDLGTETIHPDNSIAQDIVGSFALPGDLPQ